ncbi:hypothetical protein AMTRI_Chr08g166260 [Amborella trichopoda]|uniref:probable methyltransferase PMT23 n=1 Tax=Amborella trichopoda TaxID=13333 RepID=UPI0005D40CB1|nr:probable methyltransferase PMT23 [Amborella trichopoda]|eukprot:XP_011624479.1 probable methyltransferase PMT23 [Amborella trichopoda]
MAFHEYLKQTGYPFICAAATLVLSVSALLLFNGPPWKNYLYQIDQQRSQSLPTSTRGSSEAHGDSKGSETMESSVSQNPHSSDLKREKGLDKEQVKQISLYNWVLCGGPGSMDYIPCLDNMKAIKALKSRKRMEHRERHCPKPSLRCLVPLPKGYRKPVPWPKSRDMVWLNNVPHTKLVEYKKDQNWVQISGDYLSFPGGGTQFKNGVSRYVRFIEKIFPYIKWGKDVRVILDVGCGVASFGGYLLDKGVLTMSMAPKDEHEAQIQLALERGIPAVLSVIGTQRLTFPNNVYDIVHCARCRVHWDGDGGKPLLEINRVLRPGGFFVWSATPVYRDDPKDQDIWKAMVALTESICWTMLMKETDSDGIGFVIYQKPVSNSCYKTRAVQLPPLCEDKDMHNATWYIPLGTCLYEILSSGSDNRYGWPEQWPERLNRKPLSLSEKLDAMSSRGDFYEDGKFWTRIVSDRYLHGFGIDWSGIQNIMDMNAVYGGFAAALIYKPVWVMNVVPIDGPNTLPVIFDRGLIGIYHDWCESFNTYPRTYDLLHAEYLFGNLLPRCDIIDVTAEMDRILRPGGWVVVHDTMVVMEKLLPLVRSLHWDITLSDSGYLVARKGEWRPSLRGSNS